ncbi:MAG: hypothetical protein KAQ85_00915, partial [Thermodesulfovibrionia bacterium]|nr:hypothetical protein [Thermodesulfovibrionia bacterium]
YEGRLMSTKPLKPGETEIRTANNDGSISVLRGFVKQSSVNLSQPRQTITDHLGNVVDTVSSVQTSVVSLELIVANKYTVQPDNNPKRSKIITDIRKKLGLEQ